jgi:hypothetical protein
LIISSVVLASKSVSLTTPAKPGNRITTENNKKIVFRLFGKSTEKGGDGEFYDFRFSIWDFGSWKNEAASDP